MTHSCAPSRPHRLRPVYDHTPIRPGTPPTHAEIASLAHSYWEARGRHGGSHLEDWFRAEKELRERMDRP